MSFVIDHLFNYAELTGAIQSLAAAHPDLIDLSVLGDSHEGRPIWLATVTDSTNGLHSDKPAIWVDANIHSVEITGSMAALHLLRTLVTRRDEAQIAEVLATRTFYIVPRVNPDGAELALAADPTYLRSSVRPLPTTSSSDGLRPADVDGDGRVLDMRIADANGAWKISPLDSRLMVPRQPEDVGDGPWYRVVPEGLVTKENSKSPTTIRVAQEPRRLDLNRNFPASWMTEERQAGSGPTPLSEPEVRAVVDGVLARPNICVYVAHHTFSAAILRPYDDRPDTDFPGDDLRRYKMLCDKGSQLTGYRPASVYHDFQYDKQIPMGGSADSWAYDHLGVWGFTTEFWSPLPHAGIADYHLTEWFENHPIEDEIALLEWSDNELNGEAFVDWYRFDHPDLGPVEIGGWDTFRCWENAPPSMLEPEIAPHTEWEIWLALTTPQLHIREITIDRRADGAVVVHCVVENVGHFPTNVTEQANVRKSVSPVVAVLSGSESVELLSGSRIVELGQLEGRERVRTAMSWAGHAHDFTTDRAVATWVLAAEPGSELSIEVSHPRAGRVTSTIAV